MTVKKPEGITKGKIVGLLRELNNAADREELPKGHQIDCLCPACLYITYRLIKRRTRGPKISSDNFFVGWCEVYCPDFEMEEIPIEAFRKKKVPWALEALNEDRYKYGELWDKRYRVPVLLAAIGKNRIAEKMREDDGAWLFLKAAMKKLTPSSDLAFKIIRQIAKGPQRLSDVAWALNMKPVKVARIILEMPDSMRQCFSVLNMIVKGHKRIVLESNPLSEGDIKKLAIDSAQRSLDSAYNKVKAVRPRVLHREDPTGIAANLQKHFKAFSRNIQRRQSALPGTKPIFKPADEKA